MITSMKINNFKCFKDFDISLGPFNVLVGPNDSGKTSFLQAVFSASLAALSKKSLGWGHCAKIGGFDLGRNIFWKGSSSNGEFVIGTSIPLEQFDCRLVIHFDKKDQLLKTDVFASGDQNAPFQQIREEKGCNVFDWAQTAFGEPMYVMLNPSDLRKQSPMAGSTTERISSTGIGFPTFLENLLRNDRQGFFAMEKEFYRSFPHYKSFDVKKKGNDNIINFTTKDDIEFSVQNVSDGTILYLAYLALAYQPDPPKILLIEEPENGVHHASLKKIIEVLRVLSEKKGVQIIMTTHSPYLLDLVEPEEVQVFAKDDEGAVHAKKLSDYPEVQRMKKHFMAGEIWTELSEEEIVFGNSKAGTKG